MSALKRRTHTIHDENVDRIAFALLALALAVLFVGLVLVLR